MIRTIQTILLLFHVTDRVEWGNSILRPIHESYFYMVKETGVSRENPLSSKLINAQTRTSQPPTEATRGDVSLKDSLNTTEQPNLVYVKETFLVLSLKMLYCGIWFYSVQ